jgi:hypothetical protein
MDKLLKRYIWSIAFYGAETWALQRIDQNYLEKFLNVVLEKDVKDELDRSCKKRSFIES